MVERDIDRVYAWPRRSIAVVGIWDTGAMVVHERRGNVHILDLGDGDNRFNRDSVDRINVALDEIELAEPPAALVTTASGKIWSNGLDLDFMGTVEDPLGFVADVQRIMARLLELPMPTIAAIQGHAFAGGAMLALAHDVRVMRRDRGYLCLPEVDLGMSFGVGFAALIAAKLPQPALHRLAVLGERMPADTAHELGVVQYTAALVDVLPRSEQLAIELSVKAKPVLAAIRADYYAEAIAALKGE